MSDSRIDVLNRRIAAKSAPRKKKLLESSPKASFSVSAPKASFSVHVPCTSRVEGEEQLLGRDVASRFRVALMNSLGEARSLGLMSCIDSSLTEETHLIETERLRREAAIAETERLRREAAIAIAKLLESTSPVKKPPSLSPSMHGRRLSANAADMKCVSSVMKLEGGLTEDTHLIEMDRLRQEAAIARTLEIDLKTEKRVNDYLKKEMHEMRMHAVSLETRLRSLRQDAETANRKVDELREQKNQLEEECERRARDTKQQIETLEEQQRIERERAKERERQHCAERDELFQSFQTKEELERRARDTKQQIETLEEQLRIERERAKECERQHCAERDELFRGLKTTTSARNEEADRLKRNLMDAEARCENLLLELNSVRHQMQALRSRELELEDLLRSVRAQCARSLDEERITAAAKFRKSCANTEFVEETICKLRGDLKSALQARDAMREEREALLDAYEGLQSKFDVLEQAKVATEEEERIKGEERKRKESKREKAMQQQVAVLQERYHASVQERDSLQLQLDRVCADKEVLVASIAIVKLKIAQLKDEAQNGGQVSLQQIALLRPVWKLADFHESDEVKDMLTAMLCDLEDLLKEHLHQEKTSQVLLQEMRARQVELEQGLGHHAVQLQSLAAEARLLPPLRERLAAAAVSSRVHVSAPLILETQVCAAQRPSETTSLDSKESSDGYAYEEQVQQLSRDQEKVREDACELERQLQQTTENKTESRLETGKAVEESEDSMLRERVRTLEVEVEALSRALEEEELVSTDCQMRLQAMEAQRRVSATSTPSVSPPTSCSACRRFTTFSTGRLLERSGVCVSECLVCRMSEQDNEVHSVGMRSEGTVRDGSKGQGQSVDEPHDKTGDESPLLKWRGRGLGIEWPNIKLSHGEERADEGAGTEECAGNRIGEDTERSGEGIEGFGFSTTWRDAWRNIEVSSANVAELPAGKVGMVTEGEAAEPRMKFKRYGVCFGGGVKGPSLSSPPMAKRLGDAQVYCHNPRPSPPVLLSQGGLHLLPPEHVSLLTSSVPLRVLDIDIRGAVDAVTCSSTYFENESTVDTPARPSMLAQGVRFEERVLAGEMFHEDEVDKERERVGELRRGAVSVLRCQSFSDGAGGKGRDPQAHCGADTVSLVIPSSMAEDVPRLCAIWRQVECQRAAQQEHKEARERVQREAQDRVLSALVAVGASSPTLRQARSAMVSQTVVR